MGDSSLLPIGGIQEFNAQENPKAEYGWKPGAVVNVGLKPGTNEFHGTAHTFGRDSALDARKLFTGPGLSKPGVALEQFGASSPLGTFGTAGGNFFLANGLKLRDGSLRKKWTWGGRLAAQFRAEFFNVLNKTQFSPPTQALGNAAQGGNGNPAVTTALGSSSVTPDVAISNSPAGSGAARSIPLGLKWIF